MAMVSMILSASGISRRSIEEILARRNILTSLPSRRSSEHDPSWVERSGAGVTLMRPVLNAFFISRSERIMMREF